MLLAAKIDLEAVFAEGVSMMMPRMNVPVSVATVRPKVKTVQAFRAPIHASSSSESTTGTGRRIRVNSDAFVTSLMAPHQRAPEDPRICVTCSRGVSFALPENMLDNLDRELWPGSAHGARHSRGGRTISRRLTTRSWSTFLAVFVFIFVIWTPAAPSAQWSLLPWPPWQQTSGPGGSDYRWAQVTTTHYVNPTNPDLAYWIVAPLQWTGSGAAPTKLPLVVFLHGWGANNPIFYQLWLNHLARKGRIVVFPIYQNPLTLSMFFASNAITATQQAMARIAPGTAGANRLFIDPAAGMSVIGHSFGAAVAVNLAARYAPSRLPIPKAVLLVNAFNSMIDPNLSGIPATTLLGCVVGDADTVTGRAGCDAIWDATGHMPATNRNYIWMYSDARGSPALAADHFIPIFPTALSFHGVWKLGDALLTCAVQQLDCAAALGGGFPQTDMGRWSDGVAVRPLSSTLQKPLCPAGSRAAGC
jgi:pimeloyl-ACP methyl ester carboxylesterase